MLSVDTFPTDETFSVPKYSYFSFAMDSFLIKTEIEILLDLF